MLAPRQALAACVVRLVGLGFAVLAVVIAGCADEPATSTAAASSGVSTATPPAASARASATVVPVTPEQVIAMTAAQLEPLLKAALVQPADVPQATWRVTDVPLKSPTAAVKEAESGDLTHNLGLIAGNCFVAIPVTDAGAMGVMRVFSIANDVQGTTIVSAVFRARDDMQAAIDQRQPVAGSPATAACFARVLGITMTPQVPAGKIDVLYARPSAGLPPGVGSMEFVGRISGSGQVFTVMVAAVTFAAGPLVSVVAEIAVVPRDEVPVLPGRPVDLLQAGGARLAMAIGAP